MELLGNRGKIVTDSGASLSSSRLHHSSTAGFLVEIVAEGRDGLRRLRVSNTVISERKSGLAPREAICPKAERFVQATSPILLVGIVALQQLVRRNNPHSLHLLMDGFLQLLKQDFHFLIRAVRVAPDCRYLGANLSNPIIKPACRHRGRGRALNDAGSSLIVGYPANCR